MPMKSAQRWTARLTNRHFFIVDVFICVIAPLTAMYVRFDGYFDPEIYSLPLILYMGFFTFVKLGSFYYLGLYKRFWRAAGIDELAKLLFIGIITLLLSVFIYALLRMFPMLSFNILPASLPFMEVALALLYVSTVRMSVRLFERANERMINSDGSQRVLVAGAGMAGIAIVQEMQRNPHMGLYPIAFMDDDPSKHKMKIRGVPVAGTLDRLKDAVELYKIDQVVIAMPSASGKVVRKIADQCSIINVETKIIPAMAALLDGRVSIEKMRKIQIEDLLRRDPIQTNTKKVGEYISGKKILITGGGGSIGSEFCRQILSLRPGTLIILGHGENSVFEIEQELKHRIMDSGNFTTKIIPFIADLRFKERVRTVFETYSPEVVFHAAAHKHVPLMESNPQEAITNNVLGTKNLVDLCVEYDVKRFVGVSTDKAVNPTNIMGATKRTGEMIILNAAKKTGRYFSAVRFGNVLGSRGSVVRTFQKQLEQGGPITITHPDITRYFMTIPEAVQLVLQASVLGDGGDIFVLDMGEPVKVLDMARDVIRLAGYREGLDVDIKIIGLRPGEKLYEELFLGDEVYKKTHNEKIMIAQNASHFLPENLDEILRFLTETEKQYTRGEIVFKLIKLIPEFNPDEYAKKHVTEQEA
ncbi:MAG: polysaccharide biosynthesis protein [Melioribacteraceae bacterium]|nr:polysaccharide biosynthesis protein [Melioribacteraceae bacterium]